MAELGFKPSCDAALVVLVHTTLAALKTRLSGMGMSFNTQDLPSPSQGLTHSATSGVGLGVQ